MLLRSFEHFIVRRRLVLEVVRLHVFSFGIQKRWQPPRYAAWLIPQAPEAAVRVSAADGTPLTRRVLARALADRLRAVASARA